MQTHQIVVGCRVGVGACFYFDGFWIAHQETDGVDSVDSCGYSEIVLESIGAQHLCSRETYGVVCRPFFESDD